MLEETDNPEHDGTAQSENLSPSQQALLDVFGYFNKVSLTASHEQIKIKIPRPNGIKTYLREKQKQEEKAGRILQPEELVILMNETMYDVQTVEAGNSTEILRTLLRFVTANESFQKAMENCIKESFDLSVKSQNARHFADKTLDKGFMQ